jgi:hypothetical protein
MKAFIRTQPKTAEDIKSSKDCMIRSVTLATGSTYQDVHRIMYGHGWRASSRNSKDWEKHITNTLEDLGFKWKRVAFPGVKGQSRMTARTMTHEGTWILRSAKHVAALKEGNLLDTWDCSDKCVYFAWFIWQG